MSSESKFAEFFGIIVEHFTPHSKLELVGVVFGILCIILGLINYVFTDRKKIFATKAIMDCCSAVNHISYGRIVPFVISVVALFREFVFYNKAKKKWAQHVVWLFIFIAAMAFLPIGISLISGNGFTLWDLLPALGSAIVVYAFYSQNNIVTKSCIIIGQLAYIVYNAWVGNVAALFASITPAISAIIGLIREIALLKAQKKNE